MTPIETYDAPFVEDDIAAWGGGGAVRLGWVFHAIMSAEGAALLADRRGPISPWSRARRQPRTLASNGREQIFSGRTAPSLLRRPAILRD